MGEHEITRPAAQKGENWLLFCASILLLKVALFAIVHPERSGAERIARENAMNALRRNPFAVLNLGWRVYFDYWSVAAMKTAARNDFGFSNPPKAELLDLLAVRFHLALDPNKQTESLLQQCQSRPGPITL